MLTPEQIIEYATRLNSSNILVSESMLLEALKPEDAVKISKANDKLLSMLSQLEKAFGGKIKTVDAEIKSLLDGSKSASEVLKNTDDIRSEILSAFKRFILPFWKAILVNSPGSANLQLSTFEIVA